MARATFAKNPLIRQRKIPNRSSKVPRLVELFVRLVKGVLGAETIINSPPTRAASIPACQRSKTAHALTFVRRENGERRNTAEAAVWQARMLAAPVGSAVFILGSHAA